MQISGEVYAKRKLFNGNGRVLSLSSSDWSCKKIPEVSENKLQNINFLDRWSSACFLLADQRDEFAACTWYRNHVFLFIDRGSSVCPDWRTSWSWRFCHLRAVEALLEQTTYQCDTAYWYFFSRKNRWLKRWRFEYFPILLKRHYSEAEIDELFADIRSMALKGVWKEKNMTSDYSWTFGQAFFFSGALISTVGRRVIY